MTKKKEIVKTCYSTGTVLLLCLCFIITILADNYFDNNFDCSKCVNEDVDECELLDGYIEKCVKNKIVERYEFVDVGMFTKEEVNHECVYNCNIHDNYELLTPQEFDEWDWASCNNNNYYCNIYHGMYDYKLVYLSKLRDEQYDCFVYCMIDLNKPHIRYWNETVCAKKMLVKK